MTIIEKIRAEIERQEKQCLLDTYEGRHKLFILGELKTFLSTLESEKSSGHTIEEPIDGVLYAAACGIKNATGKLEKSIELEEEIKRWWSEEYMKNSEGLPILPIVQGIARHFAQWVRNIPRNKKRLNNKEYASGTNKIKRR